MRGKNCFSFCYRVYNFKSFLDYFFQCPLEADSVTLLDNSSKKCSSEIYFSILKSFFEFYDKIHRVPKFMDSEDSANFTKIFKDLYVDWVKTQTLNY